MTFANKLNMLMNDLGLSQTKVSELTGVSKPNISQYLSGRHEPSAERKKHIAKSLGVKENYFQELLPTTEIEYSTENISVDYAAKLMHKSRNFVVKGLQQGTCPFGYAVKMTKWEYYISPKLFMEYTGVSVPVNGIKKTDENMLLGLLQQVIFMIESKNYEKDMKLEA